MNSSVVLYTAGIDSFILLKYISKLVDPKAMPVYFNLQHRYSEEEEKLVLKNEADCIIDRSINLGDIERDDAFIPNRNIFLTLAAVSKYSKTVYIGGSLSDRVVDNNKEVFDEFSIFLTKLDTKKVTITSPFWEGYKVNMAKWYVDYVGPATDLLYNTFSCFNPTIKNSVEVLHPSDVEGPYESKHCHACKACFRRNVVLNSVGISLPFYNKAIMQHYKSEFETTFLPTPRSSATLNYIYQVEFKGEE